jgi:hypothetical protein
MTMEVDIAALSSFLLDVRVSVRETNGFRGLPNDTVVGKAFHRDQDTDPPIYIKA